MSSYERAKRWRDGKEERDIAAARKLIEQGVPQPRLVGVTYGYGGGGGAGGASVNQHPGAIGIRGSKGQLGPPIDYAKFVEAVEFDKAFLDAFKAVKGE